MCVWSVRDHHSALMKTFFLCILLLFWLKFFLCRLFSPPSGSAASLHRSRRPFLGRVMSKWLDLTSLQAQRHSNSLLPGSLLSLGASPLLFVSCTASSYTPPLFFFLPFLPLSLCVFILSSFALPHLMLFPLYFVLPSALSSPFWSFLFSSKAALCPLRVFFIFFYLFPNTNTGRHSVFEVSRQKAVFIPIQLHLSRSTLFLDNTVS